VVPEVEPELTEAVPAGKFERAGKCHDKTSWGGSRKQKLSSPRAKRNLQFDTTEEKRKKGKEAEAAEEATSGRGQRGGG
jgi:hypothetical protein